MFEDNKNVKIKGYFKINTFLNKIFFHDFAKFTDKKKYFILNIKFFYL